MPAGLVKAVLVELFHQGSMAVDLDGNPAGRVSGEFNNSAMHFLSYGLSKRF